MALPAGAIMQLMFIGEAFLQRIMHVRTFQLVSGGTAAGTPQQWQDNFLGVIDIGAPQDLVTPYLDCLTSAYTLREVRAQIIWPTRYAYSFTPAAAGTVGLRGATAQGLLAANLEGSTQLAGRTEVANYHIGPIAAGDCDNGLVKTELLGLLSVYADTFITPIVQASPGDATWGGGIYHKKAVAPADEFTFFVQAEPYSEVRGKTTRTVRRGI